MSGIYLNFQDISVGRAHLLRPWYKRYLIIMLIHFFATAACTQNATTADTPKATTTRTRVAILSIFNYNNLKQFFFDTIFCNLLVNLINPQAKSIKCFCLLFYFRSSEGVKGNKTHLVLSSFKLSYCRNKSGQHNRPA